MQYIAFAIYLDTKRSPVLKNVCVPPTTKFWPKVPPQEARNRDKAELATKVRNQVQTVLMWTMTKKKALILVFHVSGGTFDSNSLFKGGTFESKTHNRYICLIRGRSAYCHQSNVPPQTDMCPQPWLPWLEDLRTGINAQPWTRGPNGQFFGQISAQNLNKILNVWVKVWTKHLKKRIHDKTWFATKARKCDIAHVAP